MKTGSSNFILLFLLFSFDIGPILAQKKFIMPPDVTSLQLLYQLSNIGNELVNN